MKVLLKLLFTLTILRLFIFESLAQDLPARVFDHINNKRWEEAERVAKSSGDSALIKIALSQKFLDPSCNSNNVIGIIKFLQNSPSWPEAVRLQEKVESYLGDNADQKLVLNWFTKHKPKTGVGHKIYALAAAKIIDDHPKLATIIRNGWIYGSFSQREKENYLTKFSKFLREEDHVKKIDEFLWKQNTQEARKLMYLVSDSYKQAVEAGIVLIQKGESFEALFKNIPEKYHTPGLVFQYLKSKKKEKPDNQSITLFRKVNISSDHANEWCSLQMYYAREFIYHKDFASAYKIINRHSAVQDSDIIEAEWLAGWIALRFLNKPETALIHFKNFLKIVKTPISLSRGLYWLARTYETKGDKVKATKLYRKASMYPYTFYGQLASIELKENKIILPITPKAELHDKKSIERNDIIRAAKFFIKYGKIERGYAYAKAVIQQLSIKEVISLAKLIEATGNQYYITEFGKLASQRHVFIKEHAFPTPYKLLNSPIESALTYSIIRQESVFDQYAISEDKAMGLMQLIEGTACRTANSIKIKCDVVNLTKNPNYNILLGTHHLRDLLKERKGSYILAIASYNTASRNVDKWIKLFGDPRQMKSLREVIDWLELVPYSETRNYIQRVLENIQVYRSILTKNNRLKLKKDLVLQSV